jgi:hypothetical protein
MCLFSRLRNTRERVMPIAKSSRKFIMYQTQPSPSPVRFYTLTAIIKFIMWAESIAKDYLKTSKQKIFIVRFSSGM